MIIGNDNHVTDLPVIKARPIGREKSLRPSVEYTGTGNDLFLTSYGGRFFRASLEHVEDGCNAAIYDYMECHVYVNCNTFYNYWGIIETDFGATWGWAADQDDRYSVDLKIDIERVDDPTDPIVQMMGEPYYRISPNEAPIDFYLEL